MIRSDMRNKEIALGRIKRLASSGLPLEPFVRSIFELIDNAIPNSPNRTFHVGGESAEAYICNSPELNRVIPTHTHYYVERPPEKSGAKFRVNPFELHQRNPAKTVWMHEELTLPHLYRTEGFHEVFKPWGFHHCLMTMFHEGGQFLGCYPIWRGDDQKPFSPEDARFICSAAPHIAHGLKTAQLLARPRDQSGDFCPLPGWGSGVVLLDAKGDPLACDKIATLLFDQLRQLDDGRASRSLPSDVHRTLPELAREISRTFSPEGPTFDSSPAVSRIYAHWSGVILRCRAIRLETPEGREYITVLIERGETNVARQQRFRLRWGLSEREAEVLSLVGDGKTGPEISIILGISHDTARKHLAHVFEKLGVENRTEAALLAREAYVDTASDDR